MLALGGGRRPAASLLLTIALLATACGGSDGADQDTAAPVDVVPTAAPEATEPPPTAAPEPTEPPPTAEPTPAPTSEPIPSGDEIRAVVEDQMLTAFGTFTLSERLDELQVPGVAVAVVVDGAVLVSFGAGTTPTGEPMTPATISQVGSVSKPVAALTAATLALDGVVDWDADVQTVLSSFTLPPGRQSAEAPVTLARLFSHTAGTSVHGFPGYESAEDAPDLVGILTGEGNSPSVEVVLEPGGQFQYSGGGYTLAELALLDSTGSSSWDDLVRRQIFDPVGMPDSFYALALSDERAARATTGSLQGLPLPDRWQAHPESAAAGLWTTADDLGALLAAFGRGLLGDETSPIPPEIAQRLITPVADTPDGGAIGTGVFLNDATSPTRWSHNGQNIGYQSLIIGTTDGRFGLAVITNSIPGGEQLTNEIAGTVARALDWS